MFTRLRNQFENTGKNLRKFAAEEAILTAAELEDWERVFTLLSKMERPMDRGAAGQCLEWALHHAPVQTFDRLLDVLPKGEYVGIQVVKDMPESWSCSTCIDVRGSLTLLAAAWGKAEHLKCLLDHRWDVNSASLDAAQSLRARVSRFYVSRKIAAPPVEPYSARRESIVRILPEEMEHTPLQYFHHTFLGATPLAAAVVCGRTDCARILMDYGAWREEAPSVARALMMCDREGDAQYQACRKAVLAYGETPRPMALWAVIRTITPKQLEAELRRCRYGDEDIAEAVWALAGDSRVSPHRDPWREERELDAVRLQILDRYAPQVLRQDRQVSLLLRWGMLRADDEKLQDFLLSLYPERVDLSMVQEGLTFHSSKKVSTFLRRVCEGRTCVIDRDSVSFDTPTLVLQTLLKYVSFLPPVPSRGVSGLSFALLRTDNLPLIRKALETGAIPPEESTQDLLSCQVEMNCSAAARALLLTARRPPKTGVRPQQGGNISNCMRWHWMPEGMRDYSKILEQDCPEAQELVARRMNDIWWDLTWETEEGVCHTDSPMALMCLAGRSHTVECWLRSGLKEVLRRTFSLRCEGKDYELTGTALCIAAFSGQRETAETLLKLGAEAEEQHMGMPGLLRSSNGVRELPVTALIAALVRGQWETARLLLDHGAVCDLEQDAVKTLWRIFRQDDLMETVQRYLNGYLFQEEGRSILTAKRAPACQDKNTRCSAL